MLQAGLRAQAGRKARPCRKELRNRIVAAVRLGYRGARRPARSWSERELLVKWPQRLQRVGTILPGYVREEPCAVAKHEATVRRLTARRLRRAAANDRLAGPARYRWRHQWHRLARLTSKRMRTLDAFSLPDNLPRSPSRRRGQRKRGS